MSWQMVGNHYAVSLAIVAAIICPPLTHAFDFPTRQPITLVDSSVAGFVGLATQGPIDQPTLVQSYAQYTSTFGQPGGSPEYRYLAQAAKAFFDNSGTDLYVVRAGSNSTTSLVGTPGSQTGLAALESAEGVALVAAPGFTSSAVQAGLILHCESLQRFCILDSSSANSVSAVLTQRTQLSSTDGYAALFFPWVRVSQGGGQPDLDAPPSGFVAGIYARLTANNGVWDSPAGLDANLAGNTGLSYALTSGDITQLNTAGINSIRFLSTYGDLIWGGRTLSADSDLKYVPVRRTLSALQHSYRESLRWIFYEPNDNILWQKINSDGGSFLSLLYSQGAFQGTSSLDSYYSNCGLGLTMTNQDVIDGIVRIQVGVAIITPAEFSTFELVFNRSTLDSDEDGLLDDIEDADADGIKDINETDPYNPDSDYDGLDDGVEDANLNGMTDAGESNPLSADSDGDGLADGFEVNSSGTNPDSSDAVYTDQTLPPAGDMDTDGDTDVGDLLLLQQQLLE